MPIRRMNREQFYGQLATLDEQRLKKALWNLYWRGAAATRERIEAEIDLAPRDRGKHPSREPADPQQLLGEVADFVALARSGAYIAGDRRVSPRERTRWRLTFKRLAAAAQDGLRAPDTGAAATAVAQLIDLACQTRDYRGDLSSARSLVHAGLQQLPGHQGFLDFATQIGAPLPPRAQQIVKEHSR
jgi:hypothetical protein